MKVSIYVELLLSFIELLFSSLIGKWSSLGIDSAITEGKELIWKVDYEDVKLIWKGVGP